MNTSLLILILSFCLKHFIADAVLQTEYHYLNKGKFLHPGGIQHSVIHCFYTYISLIMFSHYIDRIDFGLICVCSLLDFFIHYIVDYTKVNLTKKYKWSDFGLDSDGRKCLRIYSNHYFIALILDQCLHFATYGLIISLVM